MPEGNPARPEGKEGKQMLERMNQSHRPLRDFGFAFIDWKENMDILDLGCGGGATIQEMLRLSPGSRICGLDYAEESLAVAAETNRAWMDKRVFLQLGDVSDLPYDAESFDLVTAVETIYFWPSIQQAFAQAARVLRHGGSLLVLCEGSDPIHNSWPAQEGMTIYSPQQIEALMRGAGLCAAQIHRGEAETVCVIGEKR